MLAKKIIACLALAAVAIPLTATGVLADTRPPEPYVVIVVIQDDDYVRPEGRGSLASRSADLIFGVHSAGVSSARYFDEQGYAGAGGASGGLTGEQIEHGDTAAGLLNAQRGCEQFPERACHIVLVNQRQPSQRAHRIAAKTVTDELSAVGYKLYSVALGPADRAHLGFNWYLTGQAFSATVDDAAGLIDSIASNIVATRPGETALPRNWDELSQIEKIWLNPHGCDLRTQWMWASDGSCHDKSRMYGVAVR